MLKSSSAEFSIYHVLCASLVILCDLPAIQVKPSPIRAILMQGQICQLWYSGTNQKLLNHGGLKMISRIWHGWTKPENADAYELLLKSEIFTGIQNREFPGYRGIQLLRRHLGDEVEFVTLMLFDSLDAVHAFAGEDYEVAVVPPKARTLLSRFDARSQHYEVKADVKP
jgi:heme-degrading monooxygenase HmoA